MIALINNRLHCPIRSIAVVALGLLTMGTTTPGLSDPGEVSSVPEIKLQIDGIGNGYSSPAVSDKLIYVTGEKDGLGYILACDWEGREIWKNSYGTEWTKSFRGSRAEPVIDQSRVYVCSGQGALICYHAETGKLIWEVDLIHDLDGQNVTYGYSMPVLIDGNTLYCSPGGKENNIVALDKYSGDLRWSSPGKGERAGYGKPCIVRRGGKTVLLTFSEFSFLGLDAATGELLWSFDLNFKGELPCNQPIYADGIIFIVAGPGNGAVALELSPDGKSISERWSNIQLNTFFGGFILSGKVLVGSTESKPSYIAVDAATGEIISRIRFGKGAVTRANDWLIMYNQRGQLGIMDMVDGKLRLIREFMVVKGTGEHFSIPVYYKQMLFIRHGDTLLGYEI